MVQLRTFAAEPIVVALEHGACHPKVRQLDRPTGVHQAVAARDIPVQRLDWFGRQNEQRTICAMQSTVTPAAGVYTIGIKYEVF